MMARMIRRASVVALAMSLLACVGCGGSGKKSAESAAPAPAPAPPDAGADALSAAATADASAERPFAKTSLEATQLIDQAIDARQKDLATCVVAARKKRKDEHAKIVLDIGIDQEGSLLGVKLPKKAPADEDLIACVSSALRTARFPRSNVGVITVKKTFEDVSIVRP